jgi:hypothetical protein
VAAVLLLLAVAGAAVAVALAVGGSSGKKAAATTNTVDTQAIQARREALAKYTKCKTSTQPLMDKLHELDSRLSVGLNYDEYTNKLGDVQVAYDEVTPAMGGQVECLTGVGIPAEAAFNQFAKASDEWGNCFDDINCSNEQVRPSLRRHWSKASTAIDQADSGLAAIKKPTN